MGKPTTSVRVTVIAVGIVYTLVLTLSGVSLDSVAKQIVAALPHSQPAPSSSGTFGFGASPGYND